MVMSGSPSSFHITNKNVVSEGWAMRGPRVLLASAVFGLSSLLVFATPETAEAYSVAAFPVIEETLAGVGGEAVVVSCAASLVCGGAAVAAFVGFTAYETRDMWLPTVQGALSGLFDTGTGESPPSSTNGCRGAADGTLVGNNTLVVDWVWKSCDWQPGLPADVQDEVRTSLTYCRAPGGQVVDYGSQNVGVGDPDSGAAGSGHEIVSLCPSGWTLIYVRWFVRLSAGWGATLNKESGDRGPESTLTQGSKMKCLKPDGSIGEIERISQGVGDKVIVPSCSQEWPGSIPKSLEVAAGPEGGRLPIANYSFSDTHSKYPDCFDAGGAFLASCKVRVFINGQPCVNGMAGCYDPDTYVNEHAGATRQCKFGSYVIAWENCSALKHHYGTTPQTQTKTVDTADPKGNPIADPAPDPEPTPSTEPSPSQAPLPTGGPNPTPPKTDPKGDPDSHSCLQEAWSWNPVDWVYVPVKCAMVWAFVPKNAPSFTDIGSPLPAGWLPSLGNVFHDGQCGPLTMPRLSLGYKHMTVGPVRMLSTCDAPWPLVRTFTYYGMEAMVLVTVMWQSFRAVTSGIGMGVNFSGGGGDE